MKTYGKRFEPIKRALFPEENAYDPNFLYSNILGDTQQHGTLPLPSNLAIYKTSWQNVDFKMF